MANLKRRHAFKRWAPDIGENRDLPEPALWFDLATGLSAEQLAGIRERMAKPVTPPEEGTPEQRLEGLKTALRARYLSAFGDFVRVQGGPHSIEGRPLVTLEDYLCIVETQADFGQLAVKDLFSALLSFNNFGGGDELFLQRLSGGSASTGPQSAAKVEPKTDGP